MRPLRVDVQTVLVASLGLVTVLLVCCTVLDPRLLAVRNYLTPYKERVLAQVSKQLIPLPFTFKFSACLCYCCPCLLTELVVRRSLTPVPCLVQRNNANASAAIYHRPLDVRDWSCKDVAWWMTSQVRSHRGHKARLHN